MPDDRNRRVFDRRAMFAAIGIDSAREKDRAGVTRDVSPGGLLFHSRSRFSLGEQMVVTYRDPGTQQERKIPARVVRVASDLQTAASSSPHLCAIEFEQPAP
jgi:hypothetical protein